MQVIEIKIRGIARDEENFNEGNRVTIETKREESRKERDNNRMQIGSAVY